MTPEQKRAVKSTILECRKILEADIEQVLINYGIYIYSPWINVKLLQNITEEEENIRKKIEEVIKKLEKSGLTTAEAVKQYIKEIVYTYVNRLSALRVLEVRGLIEQVLIPRKEWGDRSFGHLRFYEVAREYCKYQSDTGLAYFIQLIFGEISEEIRVLFNTEDEYTLITPSSEALLALIGLLCNQIDEEAWRQDEIIGWIYQYFNEKEKDDVFNRLYKKKQKIKAVDIPAATQLFTPDWIVKWIVDHSLGNLWRDIKDGKCTEKRLEDIRLLDPACGSGHFLVQAYDLFYSLYVSENYNKEEIPYLILKNNLYGIDIDLRAIQLTALILFIKVKTSLKENGYVINTSNKLSVNLVCADAVLLNGTRLERLKNQFRNNLTISKMIDIIYEEFKDTRIKGSLIQPEKRLYPLFEEYKDKIAVKEFKKLKKTKKLNQESLVEVIDANSIEEYKSRRNWSKEEGDLLGFLDLVYKEAIRANDITQQMFANEAVKSVKLIDVFMREYDITLTNPPYMGKRGMNETLKSFLKTYYGNNFVDLYASFIDRCLDFAGENGYVGMITQHSFMFTSNFIKLREKILDNFFISNLCHLGPHAFEEISGEKVSTVMFVLKNCKVDNDNIKGEYIRLINIDNPEDKKQALLQSKEKYSYNVCQNKFKQIEGYPFTYWASDSVFKLFKECGSLKKYAVPKQGMATGNNSKFLRFKWELNDFSDWKRYSKILDNSQYFTFYSSFVYWRNNGEDIRKNPSSAVRGEEYFFKEGIMYSLIGKQFKSRYLPEGIIFDKGNSCIFPKQFNIFYLLALTNSKLFSYFMNTLNPTHNFQVGDIKRIPIIEPNTEEIEQLKNIIDQIISLRKENLENNEIYDEFSFKDEYFSTGLRSSIIKLILDEISNTLKIKLLSERIDRIINKLYKLPNKDIEDLEESIERFYFDDTVSEIGDNVEMNLTHDLETEISNALYSNCYDVLNISATFNLDVNGLFNLLRRNEIIGQQQLIDKLHSYISYFIGVLFGRWNIEGITHDDDGILPIDSSIYEDDLVRRIYECIEIKFGEKLFDTVVEDIEHILGKDINEWLIKDFFKEHVQRYQKRPIYWHICSPNRTFNCIVYYLKLNNDSLYKVKGIYLAEMIRRYKEDLSYYQQQMLNARDDKNTDKENEFKKKCVDLEFKLDDLDKLNKKIDKILPYNPDINEGVLKNIIPLEPILPLAISGDSEPEEDSIEEDEEE